MGTTLGYDLVDWCWWIVVHGVNVFDVDVVMLLMVGLIFVVLLHDVSSGTIFRISKIGPNQSIGRV